MILVRLGEVGWYDESTALGCSVLCGAAPYSELDGDGITLGLPKAHKTQSRYADSSCGFCGPIISS